MNMIWNKILVQIRMKNCLVFLFLSFQIFAQTVKTDLVYLVNQPFQKTEKPPVLIMLHGYGSNEKDVANMQWLFDHRFLTFSLRGPNPVPNAGFCWYGLEFLPNKKFKYDYNQVSLSCNKVISFIREACKAYNADSNNVYLFGFSQGAMMSYEIASKTRIKGVIALSGFMNDETKKSGANTSASYFIAHGSYDNVVDYKDGKNTAAYLKSINAKVEFKTYQMAHNISNEEIKDIQNWLKTNLPETKNPGIKKK